MEDRAEIEGRFWPSRVYYRWRWWLRIGAIAVPFLVVLAGLVIHFVGARRFESRAVFEMNGRPAREAAELLRMPENLRAVVHKLELVQKHGAGEEELVQSLRRQVRTQVIHGTSLVEVRVTGVDPLEAADIAGELIGALEERDKESKVAALRRCMMEVEKMARDADDRVQECQKLVDTIRRVKRPVPDEKDPVAEIPNNESATINSQRMLKDAQDVFAGRRQKADDLQTEINLMPNPVTMVSEPSHPTDAVNSLVNPWLIRRLVGAAVAAWLGVLMLPYGLELLWPRRTASGSETGVAG